MGVSISQPTRSIGGKPGYYTVQPVLTRYPQVSGEFLLRQTEKVFRQPKAAGQPVEPPEKTEGGRQ